MDRSEAMALLRQQTSEIARDLKSRFGARITAHQEGVGVTADIGGHIFYVRLSHKRGFTGIPSTQLSRVTISGPTLPGAEYGRLGSASMWKRTWPSLLEAAAPYLRGRGRLEILIEEYQEQLMAWTRHRDPQTASMSNSDLQTVGLWCVAGQPMDNDDEKLRVGKALAMLRAVVEREIADELAGWVLGTAYRQQMLLEGIEPPKRLTR